jgi:hypothetical protein
MSYYVRVPKIAGRKHLVLFSEKLSNAEFGDRIEYHDGGWMDNSVEAVFPHFKFEFEDDALAFVLAHGGEIAKVLPVYTLYPAG